jgi:hypothetical protein
MLAAMVRDAASSAREMASDERAVGTKAESHARTRESRGCFMVSDRLR